VLPESRLGKAVQYALGQWPKLTVFLRDGEVPLDNNRCEERDPPFGIGRKGWLFSDTVAGATASASLYSLVETAKANHLETARVPLAGLHTAADVDHGRGLRSAAALERQGRIRIILSITARTPERS